MSIKLSSSAYGFAGALRNVAYGVGACAKSGISAPTTGEVRLLPAPSELRKTRHVVEFQAPKPMAGAARVQSWRPPV